METIEFKEYHDPAYFMRKRAIRAFWNHVAPVGITIAMLLVFMAMGFIEVHL